MTDMWSPFPSAKQLLIFWYTRGNTDIYNKAWMNRWVGTLDVGPISLVDSLHILEWQFHPESITDLELA